jgi:hypothetical protein
MIGFGVSNFDRRICVSKSARATGISLVAFQGVLLIGDTKPASVMRRYRKYECRQLITEFVVLPPCARVRSGVAISYFLQLQDSCDVISALDFHKKRLCIVVDMVAMH